MRWHHLLFVFFFSSSTTAEVVSAFVAPIGRVQRNQPTQVFIGQVVTQLNSARSLAVAGRIPWGKLILTRKQLEKLVSIVRMETHLVDILLMVVLSLFSVPIGRFTYQSFLHKFRDGVAFENSITYHVQEILSEAAKIGLVCYLFDVVEIALEVMGFKGERDISTVIAKLIYSTWIAFRVRRYRPSRAFDRAIKMERNKKNVVSILDKVSDFFIFGILATIWIDILNIKRSVGLSSIFALSGVGTLTITLAAQDLVKKALGGLVLASSDNFAIGDNIMLGDGTKGTVKTIGWLSTNIKGNYACEMCQGKYFRALNQVLTIYQAPMN